MSPVLLLDLVHGCCPTCAGSSLPDVPGSDVHVFLLCGKQYRAENGLADAFLNSSRSVQVLDFGSTAESLYRLKQAVDQLDLSSVTVVTTPQGQKALAPYLQQLFTDVYTFDYKILTCPCCTGSAHTDSPGPGVREEVSALVQQLPGLRGEVTVLRSNLIPDCFGHGFSTRTGGVSYIPTLSSMNLFNSSKRRDPEVVVMENRRRLALHAGFHPKPLRLVKVNHASDVWVMGEAEPENYDGIVTNQPGVVLAAPGADCMPLLFADPVSKVIGAAHAGWRGTLMGVAMAIVKAMVTGFGCQVSNIVVAVGPSVGACCFTLEKEQALDFSSIHPDCVPDPESSRPHVNIRLANRLLLQKGGILPEHIHDDTVTDQPSVTLCTSCHPELFFSHVRDGANFGVQLGFLWIRDC
ncbi:laccase domain-containing protein 1 [Mastacembelus armatus]|uniref:Purine nucleoside phosphorylase LACC1 n=1 Tax=Mastacembelus armatus TaxID=205130 RepID=A0A3Q3MWY3_9TELE|nr:laccase domain-containing protein 1 [Mastacembelus armatus]